VVIELLAGGGLTVLGFALGRLPSRRRWGSPVSPFCGCGHHHSFHAPETGQCHSLADGSAVKYDKYDTPTDWEQVPCSCRQYSGPVPVDAGYFAPDLTQGG
jgi:hypothetical protein